MVEERNEARLLSLFTIELKISCPTLGMIIVAPEICSPLLNTSDRL